MSVRMNAYRIFPQLMHLVESGKLISVTPAILSPEIFMKGDTYKRAAYGVAMHPRTCEPNARALVEAMHAEEGWAVVGGFAIGPSPEYPTRHIWVRKDDTHFDPTWSYGSDYRYFALPGIFPEGNVRSSRGLHYLSDVAAELGIELLEDHPKR